MRNAAISHVSIGVASMAPVRRLWVELFGLHVVARRTGPDPELGRLWKLPAEAFEEQLLLETPGAASGRLHFVQFAEPGAPVREGAAATDLCPKNIDVNCTDMPAHVERLEAAGFVFRSAISEYSVGGVRAREVQMPAHDELNVVLVEVLSEGFDCVYTTRGFAALTSFVVTVPDLGAEVAFYRDVFGLPALMDHRIAGPAIEAVIGLPPGGALQMQLLGPPADLFGRMELIRYEGADGRDLYPRARPPATGILRCGYGAADLPALLARAGSASVVTAPVRNVNAIYGAADYAVLQSPAGLRIEVAESQ